MARYKLDYCG